MNQIDSLDDALAFGMTFKAAENARDFFVKDDLVSEHILFATRYMRVIELFQA